MDGIRSNSNDGNNFISFSSTGLLNEGLGNERRIALCDDRDEDEGTLITLNAVGRATISSIINNPPSTCDAP
jgi:hypothetical protein